VAAEFSAATGVSGTYDHRVTTFDAADGTRLAYHRTGADRPLVCVPGGPMQASAYLGDLGGLAAHRSLVMLDLRGTGDSAEPADPATYRCDHQVADLEALRVTLGLERVDLLAHSAGAAVTLLYAARHPSRVGDLVLVTPSPRVVGVDITDADRRGLAELRRDEPWFPDAYAAFERIWSGSPTDADWDAITPFMYGRWDATAHANVARHEHEQNAPAARAYYGEGALDPAATRLALSYLGSRVLLLAGEYDVALPPGRAIEYAGLFAQADVAVQPGTGHYPWLDDPQWFSDTVAKFLG
jgi:pimeloyl-ACP methyl ester carboxylesterase